MKAEQLMLGLYRAHFKSTEWEHTGVLVFHEDGTLAGGNHVLGIQGRYLYVEGRVVVTLHAEPHSEAGSGKALRFHVVVTGNPHSDEIVLREVPQGISTTPISVALTDLSR